MGLLRFQVGASTKRFLSHFFASNSIENDNPKPSQFRFSSISEWNWLSLHEKFVKPNRSPHFRIFSKTVFILCAVIRMLYQHSTSIKAFESWLSKRKICNGSLEEKVHNFDLFRVGLNEYNDKVESLKLSIWRNSAKIRDHLPEVVDWKDKGSVTSVRDQGKCDCCWAMSTTTVVESINHIKTGKLIKLSVQELVDCDKRNNACKR